MRTHQQEGREGCPRRNAEHDGRDDFSEADVALRQPMVQQVESLHDEEGNVS